MESLVSRYENHSTATRQGIEESHALEEMIIARNAPLVQHADAIVEGGMNSYWREKKVSEWHFIRKSDSIKSYTGDTSNIIGRLVDTKSKLPFMEN